jgi:hypothetical protein
MTLGATENVTPIHSALAADTSTEAVDVAPTITDVSLAAVATAPPECQTPVP